MSEVIEFFIIFKSNNDYFLETGASKYKLVTTVQQGEKEVTTNNNHIVFDGLIAGRFYEFLAYSISALNAENTKPSPVTVVQTGLTK